MPKEQSPLGEHNPRATSSKNAKEKSNSLTLLAIRRNKDTHDSGYSDGSDWQQTDAEDWRSSNKNPPRCNKWVETTQPGKNQQVQRGSPGIPIVLPAVAQRRDQLLQRNVVGKEMDSSAAAARVIFLQQPGLLSPPVQLHRALSQRTNPTGKNTNSSYQAIVSSSYPPVTLHVSKKPSDKKAWTHDEPHILSKRVCTEHKSHDAPVTRSLPDLCKQPKLPVSTAGPPRSPPTRGNLSSSSPVTVSTHKNPSDASVRAHVATRGLHRNSATPSFHHKRFQTTLEILRQSGLLDITLRTKELLRQSNNTQQDVDQLRQHAELLCQAASNPGCSLNCVTGWEYLHRAMVKSGNYPNLKDLQKQQVPPHPHSAGIPEGRLDSKPQPNQSCAAPQQQSDSGQYQQLSSEKVTVMPPDSSTG